MAQRSSGEKSPEQLAQDQIRYADTLQEEQQRRDKITARTLHRNQAVQAGIPKSMLPDPSQIKNMDDATWNQHAERMSRMGFHGMDAQGRLLPPPKQGPLVLPNRLQPRAMMTPRMTAPVEGPLEAGARKTPPVVANNTAPATLDAFSTTPADARAIAQRYGDPGTAQTRFDSTPGTRRPFIAGADGKNVAGQFIDPSDKSLDPAYVSTLNPKKAPENVPLAPADQNAMSGLGALRAEPFRNISLNSRTPMLNTDLSRPGPVFPVEQTVQPSAPNAWATKNLSRTASPMVGIDQPVVPGPTSLESVASAAKTALNTLTTPVGGTQSTVMQPRNATNASAAQFEKPTKENPVPVTPTTPTSSIDQSENAIGRFGLSEDELNKRKEFAGF